MKTLGSTAALIALLAAAPVLAQTAPQSAPQAELPGLLQGLELGGLSVETKRDGQREYEGRLPDGTEIEAEFDIAGNLLKIEADDGVLPQQVVEAALSPAILGHEAMSLFARIQEIERGPRHIGIEGRQADGRKIALRFDSNDRLTGIDSDGGAVPPALIEQILPQAVRGTDMVGNFAAIDRIRGDDGRYEMRGRDAAGAQMRAQFDESGTLLRFRGDDGRDGMRKGRGRDDGPEARGPGGRPAHAGPEGRRPHAGGPEGRPPHAGGPGGRPPHAGGPEGRPRHAGPGGVPPREGPGARGAAPAPMPEIDTVAIGQRLADAGYGDLGLLMQRGPRLMLQASNPDGEPVMLELDPEGEILRETAR